MRVFHVKHSGECVPAPPARFAPPRCLERPGGDASRVLFESTLFSPLTALRPSLSSRDPTSRLALCSAPRPSPPLRAVAPPLPASLPPRPFAPRSLPPRPSLPFSCGLLRFLGFLATMFHVKHSSAFCSRLHLQFRFRSPPSPPVPRLCRSPLSRPSGARPPACLPLPLARPSFASHLPAPRFPEPRPASPRPAPVLSPSFLTLS